MSALILIAESEDGEYEPIATVASIEEAVEVASSDFKSRDPNADMCPWAYKVWERGEYGKYQVVQSLEVTGVPGCVGAGVKLVNPEVSE